MVQNKLAIACSMRYSTSVHQIVFNEISAAEISALPTVDQLSLMDCFQVDEASLSQASAEHSFGIVEREGRKLYRYRLQDYRIYFTVETEDTVVVQRVLHANTLEDFLFRSKMGGSEDHKLSRSRSFWKLIEEGEKAPRR